MLIAFSGLPGSGKTTISRLLARRLGAVHLRIDTIEPPIQAAYGHDIADVGYRVAYGVAADNLTLGRTVVVDCVNDVNIARDAWREMALRTKVALAEFEVRCSDAREHRRRVETRIADVPGLILPSWEEIVARRQDAWLREHIVIDTAGRSPDDCLIELMARLPRDMDERRVGSRVIPPPDRSYSGR
jgi:predicted kinase